MQVRLKSKIGCDQSNASDGMSIEVNLLQHAKRRTMRVVLKLGDIRHVSENVALPNALLDFLLTEKPGDFVRNQLETWAAVGKPWVTDRRDLMSSLALSSIGGASSSEKLGRRQKTLSMIICAKRFDVGSTTYAVLSLQGASKERIYMYI